MAHRILGLDIAADRICGTVIETSLRGRKLVFHHQMAIDPTSGEDHPAAAEQDEAELLGPALRALRDFLLQIDSGFDEIVVAMPARSVVWRTLELPFTKRSKIQQVVPFEVESGLPYDLSEMLLNTQLLQTRDNTSLIGVYLTRKEVIAAQLAKLGEFGVDPRVITPGHWALINAARPALEGSQGLEVVIDVGYRNTLLALFDNGGPRAVRTISRGGRDITEALARELNCSLSEAERGKQQEVNLDPNQPGETTARLREIVLRALEPWMTDLRQTLNGLAGERKIERVLISGGTSTLQGFADWLSDQLETTVERFDPFAAVPQREIEPDPATAPYAALCAGLALVGAGSPRSSKLNFRTGPFAAARVSQQLGGKAKPLIVMAAVLAVLLIANCYMGYAATRGKSREAQQHISTIWRENFPGEPVPSNVRATFEERIRVDREKLKLIGELGDGSVSTVDLLYRMSDKTPASDLTVDFKRMEITTDVVRIEGEVNDFEDVDRVESVLKQLDGVSSIRKENVDRTPDGKVKFKLIISLVTK
ncbi:MAG: type II secretion system protein GspL [Candidatus Alcyoniella australis]|nr:type II secretion system protein GspL [Candidatus Alcyoniella australis]